ncbi:DNA methyltransferase [Ruegeria atlantica]|uniref:DNA methyltransferase n=1 Tax=Ruegeria atlantica TaxID=81569 RepID=UPI002494D9CF|nr:DNA methyltransferase [Ruegeria atlantica]
MTKHRHTEQTNQPNQEGLDTLYGQPLAAKRNGSLFGAFPYPTKISPEAIALYIAAHTKPGDTVLDVFAGSGTTGLAALLCEQPTEELKGEAARLGLDVMWGARNAVLYEIGALGSFVGRTLTAPPAPEEFSKAAINLLEVTESELAWIYECTDPGGNVGTVRYAIWSDILCCPCCKAEVSLWDSCVSFRPASISSEFVCLECGHKDKLDAAERLIETTEDPLLQETIKRRKRKIARVYGVTGKSTWSREPLESDLDLLERVASTPLPAGIPNVEIPWGDLHRSGYHQGISHLHHFYTRRNLIVFGNLWARSAEYSDELRDALRFWLLSYNASHATIMTRVVAKSGQNDLVVTSSQPGVLYVSGLPVEKNLFAGLRRKLSTIKKAFSITHEKTGNITVVNQSSCSLNLADASIDYALTDPPFGGNIPYAEVNFINEAWLQTFTDREEEAIISRSQGKAIEDYQELLSRVLGEVHRVLKPSAKATLVFHSATASVWNALQSAYSDAGFFVERASVLDKKQGSFKQVTTKGAVKGDPVLLLGRESTQKDGTDFDAWIVAKQLFETSLTLGSDEQTPQRLYSRLVNYYLGRNLKVPIDADELYRWHGNQMKRMVDDNVGC